MFGIRSPDGLVVGLAAATLGFPNERNQGKQGATLCKSTGFLTGPNPPPREQLCNRYCSNKHTPNTEIPHANSFVLGPAVINTHTPYFLTVTVEAGSNRSIISLFFF